MVSGDFAAFFLQNKKRGKRDGHRMVAVVFLSLYRRKLCEG